MMIVDKQILCLNYKWYLLEISYFVHTWNETTILFLHWLGSSKDVFLEAIQNEEINKHTLIGFDFPWHWESKYITKFDIDDLVQITHLVINALKINNFIVVGHSMWGLIALLYLKNNVNSIKAFINVEWNLTKDDSDFSWYISSLDYKRFKEEFWNNEAMFDLSTSIVEYSKNWNLLNIFISLSLPRLFVYGDKHNILYIPELEKNKIQVMKISKSWHHPFNENPKEFYGLIENYIENLYRKPI